MTKHRRGGRGARRRIWPWLVLVAVLAVAIIAWLYRAPIAGYSGAGTAYAARVGCSCRFVAGRDLDDCAKDKLAGMEAIVLSEDADEKSVTATFPLLRSETARLKDGYGCVLDPWDG